MCPIKVWFSCKTCEIGTQVSLYLIRNWDMDKICNLEVLKRSPKVDAVLCRSLPILLESVLCNFSFSFQICNIFLKFLSDFLIRREKLNIFHTIHRWRGTVTNVLVLAISAEAVTKHFSGIANLFIHRSVTDWGSTVLAMTFSQHTFKEYYLYLQSTFS